MDEPTTPTSTDPPTRGRRLVARYWWLGGLAIAGIVAALAAAFASSDPDGLTRVAIDQGFEKASTQPGFSVIPGYVFPGLDGTAAAIVAGIVGIAIVFTIMLLVGRALARRRKSKAD